ncbi:hypothetical protein KCU65_g2952, partial [Aureobasidium melanogenum]
MEGAPQIIQKMSSLSQEDYVQFLKNAYSLVAKCYNEENDEQCIEGSQYLLDSYNMSSFLRMKLYTLISMASDDWFIAEQYRERAEHIYTTEINKLPVGAELDKDFVKMRNELDELAQCQIENKPDVDDNDDDFDDDDDDEYPEPYPQSLVVPDLVAIVGKDGTQEEYQRVQYLIEDCEDADEIYDKKKFAAYADALQRIIDSSNVPALLALRLCILISSNVPDRKLAKVNMEIAEILWEEQRDEWDSQMSPDVDSFMQAARDALDLLAGDTSGDATKLDLPYYLTLHPDAGKYIPGASVLNNQDSSDQNQDQDQINKRSFDEDSAEKFSAATGSMSLDKELPPFPTDTAGAEVQRFKPESQSGKQSLTNIIPSANKSSKAKEPLASAVSPSKGKDLLQHKPADSKQDWLLRV